MSSGALRSCATLELSGRSDSTKLEAAADCYARHLSSSPLSTAAACGLLRSQRLWVNAARAQASGDAIQDGQVAAWRARVSALTAAAGIQGAGRCLKAAANTSMIDGLLATLPSSSTPPPPPTASTRQPPPRASIAHGRTKAVRLTDEGRQLAASGRLEAARAKLRAAVAADSSYGEAFLMWGLCESHLGNAPGALEKLATAERLLSEEMKLMPPSETTREAGRRAATAAFEVGNLHYHVGRREEAEAAYRRALRTNPRYAEPLSNLGVLAYTGRRYAEAASRFERAIAVLPTFADAYQHLGAARKALGAADAALAAYRTSARLSPRASEPLRGCALVLRERGRLAEAVATLASALRLAPAEAQLHMDLGITHDYAERREDAMAAYEAAMARLGAGEAADLAHYLHGRSAKSMAYWRGWDAYNSFLRRRVRSAGGAARLSVDPVASLSSPFTGPELLQVVSAAAATKLAEGGSIDAMAPAAGHARSLRRGGARLVVGLVSSYFRDHNLLRLTRSFFSLADKSALKLVLFAESEDDRSELLRRTQASVDAFIRIRSMSTADAVHAMASHNLHLAINLNGHHWNAASESVRFGLFGRHSSPVSAAYMGYPGPTGAPNLQYTYVDAHAAPAAHRAHFTERLVHLPHTYYLNDYADSHASLEVRPDRLARSVDGLSRDCAYLCSVNQLPKLDPQLYSAWLNALSRARSGGGGGGGGAPCTRLWLLKFPASGEAHLQREAMAHASPPPRGALVGLPTVKHADHLLRAQHCELKLDSTLCNAHTSGTDSLWAGTPMLTLPGETQAARVALSLLTAVGLPQTVARSVRAYEDAVVHLVRS